MQTAPLDSGYWRPAAFCWAFFCRRGRRDLFFGASFGIFSDLVDGLAAGGGASVTATAADSFLSTTSLSFFAK